MPPFVVLRRLRGSTSSRIRGTTYLDSGNTQASPPSQPVAPRSSRSDSSTPSRTCTSSRQPGGASGHQAQARVRRGPPPLPDWRITCIFVDKRHRAQGIARAGLEEALDQIARLGGGLVEAIPEVTAGREAQGRFLFSATVELFAGGGGHVA